MSQTDPIYHLDGTYSKEFKSNLKEDPNEMVKLSEMFQFETDHKPEPDSNYERASQRVSTHQGRGEEEGSFK